MPPKPRPKPRPCLFDIEPYELGAWSVPGVDRVIRLSANESAVPSSPRVRAALAAMDDAIRRYPDDLQSEMRDALAAHYGLDAARMVLGNGSEELIALLCRAYAAEGDEVIYSQYGYMQFRDVAQGVGATPVMAPAKARACDVDGLLSAVTPRTRVLLLANPNNPTGSCLPAAEIERLHRGLRGDILLVLDAAYAEFVMRDDYDPGAGLVEASENVVMLRTFSKAYGLAGMRLGWAYCPPEVGDMLDRLRAPSNASAPAIVAGMAALGDTEHFDRVCRENARLRDWFSDAVAKLGLEPYPAAGNFVLLRFPGGDGRNADAVAADEFLLARGIIARPMGGYDLGDCLRFTIGTEDEMRAVVAALADFVG